MKNDTFSFEQWRYRLRDLGYRGSKTECAHLLGINPHTYIKYENNPQSAPAAYKLAAVSILMGYRYD